MLRDASYGAIFLAVKKARFYQLVREQVLPPGVIVKVGRQIRVDEDSLREWAQRGGSAQEPEQVQAPGGGSCD